MMWNDFQCFDRGKCILISIVLTLDLKNLIN